MRGHLASVRRSAATSRSAKAANLVLAPQLIGLVTGLVATRTAVPSELARYVLAGAGMSGFWAAHCFLAATKRMADDLECTDDATARA